MKKNIQKYCMAMLCCLCLGWGSPVHAQDIGDIRKQYAEIHHHMDLQKREIHMQNTLEMTLQHNVPGIGPQKIHYQLQLSPLAMDGNGEPKPHLLKFAEGSYNIAGATYYEEFLYNAQGEVIFVYARQPVMDEPETYQEVRMYYEHQQPLKISLTKCVNRQKQSAVDCPISRPLPKEIQKLYTRAVHLHTMFISVEKNLIP